MEGASLRVFFSCMKNWREDEPRRATNKREKDYEATTKLAQKREGENKKTAAGGGSIQTRHPFLQANAHKKVRRMRLL